LIIRGLLALFDCWWLKLVLGLEAQVPQLRINNAALEIKRPDFSVLLVFFVYLRLPLRDCDEVSAASYRCVSYLAGVEKAPARTGYSIFGRDTAGGAHADVCLLCRTFSRK
jgi:hypothetical protein